MPETPRVGSEIAGYRLESLIQRGGMAVVFVADHIRLGRKVAFKVLALELSEEDRFRERFLRESRLAARINHPNIIPIYDAGEADGLLFIAMLYVGDVDLKKLIAREGPLEAERALSLVGQTGSALDAAHAQDLIHRDVKPGNILVVPRPSADGHDHVYLSDFGLTKHAGSRSGLTATGQFVGTLDYVAPEVIEGKDVDSRTDIYSLGCVLYECLVGRTPFSKDDEVAVLWAHIHDDPPRVSKDRSDLPPAIDAVIAKALAKSPDDRYQSCLELVSAARAALQVSSTSLPHAAEDAGSTALLTGLGSPPLRPHASEADRVRMPPTRSESDPAIEAPDRSTADRSVSSAAHRERARWSPGTFLVVLVAFLLGAAAASTYLLTFWDRQPHEIYDKLVVEHLPSHESCSQVQEASPDPAGNLPADGVLAEALCRPVGQDGIEARYYLIHSQIGMQTTFYDILVDEGVGHTAVAARKLEAIHEQSGVTLPELSDVEAMCRDQEGVANLWMPTQTSSTAHEELALGVAPPPTDASSGAGPVRTGGLIACYTADGTRTLAWTDNQTTILTIATGPRGVDLYSWWESDGGPATEQAAGNAMH